MLQKLFNVADVTNKYLFSFSLPVSMSLCYNICFEKEIQLLLDNLICLEMLSYGTFSDKKKMI